MHGLATLAVADLGRTIADVVAHGLRAPAIETIDGAGRMALMTDPQDNVVNLIEVLSTSS